jgi:hypothetical protein
MAAPKYPPEVSGFGEFLKESASRDPIGRLLTTVHRLGKDSRMGMVAKQIDLSEGDFLQAVAEAEWGGLIKREKREDGIYLILTSQGVARAEAILR